MNRRSRRSRSVSIVIGMNASTTPNRAIAPARHRQTIAVRSSSHGPVSCHCRSFQPNTKNGSMPNVRVSANVESIVSM